MFRYDYIPVDQLKEGPEKIILKEGNAHFRIHAVWDKDKEGNPLIADNGKPKIRLVLHVTDVSGKKGLVYDSITSNTPWKVHQLSDALAMSGLYNQSGVLDIKKLIGGEGECLIKTDTKYGERTVIAKYLPNRAGTMNAFEPDSDDDLPF